MEFRDIEELKNKQAELQAECELIYQKHFKEWTNMHTKSQDYPQAVTELFNQIRKFYDIDSQLFLNTAITAALKRCRNEALEEAVALAKGWAKEWVMKTDRQRFDTYQVEFQRRNVGIGIAEDIAKLKEAE